MIRRCLARWIVVVFGLVFLHSAAAVAAESITVTPPADAIAGVPFRLTVSTTSESPSTTLLRVFVRPDDGRPCEASAAAVNASFPKPAEVFGGHRPAAPVTVEVPAQSFVGGLRVCAFVELVPAPQTTLSTQDLAVGVRAPRGTLQLQVQTASPFFGKSFTASAQGSTEAPDGSVVMSAQRAPCASLSGEDLPFVGGLAAGAYDQSEDFTIDPGVAVVPNRVCAWLYAASGLMLLASAEQPISPHFDGSLVVIQKRFIKLRTKSGRLAGWVADVKGESSGNVAYAGARIIHGGACAAGKHHHTGRIFDLQCLLKRPPLRPFVVEVTYTTGVGVERSAGRVTIPVPKQTARHRH
jgi:hypothetical protein